MMDQASEQTILKERKMKNEGQLDHHISIYVFSSECHMGPPVGLTGKGSKKGLNTHLIKL